MTFENRYQQRLNEILSLLSKYLQKEKPCPENKSEQGKQKILQINNNTKNEKSQGVI